MHKIAFMMRAHMISISCLHMPSSLERKQGVQILKILAMPVPKGPSMIENMLFPCILIKISLLIKPSHYLKFSVNSISHIGSPTEEEEDGSN